MPRARKGKKQGDTTVPTVGVALLKYSCDTKARTARLLFSYSGISQGQAIGGARHVQKCFVQITACTVNDTQIVVCMSLGSDNRNAWSRTVQHTADNLIRALQNYFKES